MNEIVREIARRVHACGGRALLVGGCVRDGLLGRPCYDIDCEVHGLAPDALRALLGPFGDMDESGRAYGIYKLKGAGVDVALPRRERRTGTGHSDFAVTIAPNLTPKEAAARRDFTVNAIMRDALTGEYVDPYGGIDDLRNGVLRAVPGGQFEEDPLRVLRGAQFAARFHLTPDAHTVEQMRRMPLCGLSAARVMAETKKALLLSDAPDVFFRVLKRADALAPWFAELSALIGVRQNTRHHPEGDAFEHTMRALRAAARALDERADPLAFMLAVLTHDLGKAVDRRAHAQAGVPLCEAMLARIGARKADIRLSADICRLHMRAHDLYHRGQDEAVSNLLLDEALSADDLVWAAVCDTRGTGRSGEKAAQEEAFLLARLDAYARIASGPMPTAQMLIDLGAEPGPALGRMMQSARRYALCGETPQTACRRALEENPS